MLWRRVQQKTERALLLGELKKKKGQAVMNSEFTMGQGAGQKLEFAFQRNNVGGEVLEWLSTGENLKLVTQLAFGEAELVAKTKPPPKPETVIDPTIHVDRSIRPTYPSWTGMVMHPELENVGPTSYNITTVDQWLHDRQQNGGCVKGQIIYDYLEATDIDALKTCLGLRDLEEIQKKGVVFFREHFKGKAVFGLKSVVRDHNGRLYAPYLFEYGDEVILHWHWLEYGWNVVNPALRFASSQG